MEWTNDPILVANTYIEAFTNEFNKDRPLKDIVARTGKTKRPFVAIDTLRDKLIEKKVINWKTTPQEFIQRCREINEQQVKELDIKNLTQKRAKDLNFALGMLDFTWI
jgi:hypothetical protein